MSLMFAKQFSEAGVAGNTTTKKGGRGRGGGSGLNSKSRRGGRSAQEDATDPSGLFNMDNNYRTHMLFPGRKDEDGSGGEPRRSSGSPSFMKAMMSWSKRPSDPKSAQNSQELARYRGTPTRNSESEFDCLPSDPLIRKTVSFHNFSQNGSVCSPNNISPASPRDLFSSSSPDSPTNHQNDFYSYHQPFRENYYASFVGGMLYIYRVSQ